jgi:hypothetical protein
MLLAFTKYDYTLPNDRINLMYPNYKQDGLFYISISDQAMQENITEYPIPT